MKKIRTAVIGVGYLGTFHAEKYAHLHNAQLVAVCDDRSESAKKVAASLHCQPVSNYKTLIGQVDAVSIVVPTPLHHEIGSFFLSHGIHVLIEKPIAVTLKEADNLIKIAKKNKALLQIGHLERFNNTIKALAPLLHQPLFIESTRLSPFKLRGSDVSVILDLMIHDIDLIQSIVKSDIRDISANGAAVLTDSIDIANARITFKNGCIANVTANRVSQKTERKLRVFQHDCYIGADLHNKRLSIQRKGSKEMFPGIPEITVEEKVFDQGDALKDEIEAFLNAIHNHQSPVVTGEDGRQALETALKITKIIKKSAFYMRSV